MGEVAWSEVSDLIDGALDQPPETRLAFIEAKAADRPDLRAEALSLLEKIARSERFLEDQTARPGDAAAVFEPLASGTRFGAWQVDGPIAQGGMGAVYRVTRQEGGFDQVGALKVMRVSPDLDRRRFEGERQILAHLDHPGIARILDGGVDESGHPWMVQEYVTGGAIDLWCDSNNASAQQRIRLVIKVIEAVGQAHRKLILHRDLKPSNVLIDSEAHPRVIDFGLAKALSFSPQTESPLPISAPYAAPELLTGEAVGPTCDVYGAAALLYELMTGAPPIPLDGVPIALGLGRILDMAPRSLADHAGVRPLLANMGPAMRVDLDHVLSKALRKEPDARYATLDALAQDLERVLAREPVAARQGERGYRLRRQAWRWRWPIAAGLALFATMAAGIAATTWQAREAIAARDAAIAEEAQAESVRQSLYVLMSEGAEIAAGDASRREVLNSTTQRVMARYALTPEKEAPVLHALGELYFYLGDYAGAIATLRPIVDGADRLKTNPDVLAAARFDLAQSLSRSGDTAEANALLAAAQGHWKRDPVKWRAKLTDSRLFEAQLLREKDPEAALALMQRAYADHLAASGANNRQAGKFQNNLGVAYQSMGELDQARGALLSAQATWRVIGETDTPDALNTANNLAAIETLSGRPKSAAPLFAEALRLRRQLFGASAGTAAVLNNYGKVLLQIGEADRALPLLVEAAEMGRRFAGSGSVLHVSALAGVSEAYLARKSPGEALISARQAAQSAGAQPSPPFAIARIALARALAETGDTGGALRELRAAQPVVKAMGPPAARLQKAIDDVAATHRLTV